MRAGRVEFHAHAFERMFQRGISVTAVLDVLKQGEVIEDYPNYGGLVLGRVDSHPLHVVYADTDAGVLVITTYWPDPTLWDVDFRKRVKP